jgi:2'-5' RNA ligase
VSNLLPRKIIDFILQVIFAKVQRDKDIQRVSELASTVAKSFESLGFGGDSKSFKPHLTLAKMSKGRTLNKKVET